MASCGDVFGMPTAKRLSALRDMMAMVCDAGVVTIGRAKAAAVAHETRRSD